MYACICRETEIQKEIPKEKNQPNLVQSKLARSLTSTMWSQLKHTVNLNETYTKNKLQYLLKSPFPCRKRTTGIFQESSVSQTYSQGETPFGARSGIFCWLGTQKVIGESNFALSFLGPADIVIGNRWIFITVFLYQGS